MNKDYNTRETVAYQLYLMNEFKNAYLEKDATKIMGLVRNNSEFDIKLLKKAFMFVWKYEGPGNCPTLNWLLQEEYIKNGNKGTYAQFII